MPGAWGELDYPCDGGGVTATFGSIVSTGRVRDGLVELTAGTRFDWQDGCTWETSQRISGRLADGQLAYEYEEKPVAGTACASACSASGRINVVWE